MAAAKDLKAGTRQAAVARKYGVSIASVCPWAKTLDEDGAPGLKMRKSPGYAPRLSRVDTERLKRMFVEGAFRHG